MSHTHQVQHRLSTWHWDIQRKSSSLCKFIPFDSWIFFGFSYIIWQYPNKNSGSETSAFFVTPWFLSDLTRMPRFCLDFKLTSCAIAQCGNHGKHNSTDSILSKRYTAKVNKSCHFQNISILRNIKRVIENGIMNRTHPCIKDIATQINLASSHTHQYSLTRSFLSESYFPLA